MANFKFSSEPTTPVGTTFNGPQFYNVYKNAEFLRIDANVQRLLAQGYELRKKLSTVEPGKTIVIKGMNLERNTPLLIKNTAKNIKVEDYEFTYNRLVGLDAGYAYENRHRFPNLQSSEAKALGLVWDQNNNDKCKLYLSAVSGTEHLIDQFSFWPLMCGLRKFQLKKLSIELVVKMGNIKNADGETMAKVLKKNSVTARRVALMFTGTSLRDWATLIDETPEIKKLFQEAVIANFKFSSEPKTPTATTFNGPQFYNVYKHAEFLRIDANVQRLLAQGYELRRKLITVEPGKTIVIEGMNLERNTPLLIKNTAKNIKVEDYEFTYNRLVGLAAGYAYENRHRFPNIQSREANALGLVWDQNNNDKCKLYLSAVSGTEHLIDQFSFWPLLCGLRKFQLKKLPIELVVKMGNIKNADGETMAKVLKNNSVTARRVALMIPGTSLRDWATLIEETPEITKLFQG